MKKSDKIVFCIIETIIIVIVLGDAYYIWKKCHLLPNSYVPMDHSGMNSLLRIYRFLPEICLASIFMGTMMNISSLFIGKLKFFSELTWISRIFVRIYAAIVGLIVSYVILLVVEWVYTLCQ